MRRVPLSPDDLPRVLRPVGLGLAGLLFLLLATACSIELTSSEERAQPAEAATLEAGSPPSVAAVAPSEEVQLATVTHRTPLDKLAELIFLATNRERQKRGLGRLQHDPALDQLAQEHSRDMLRRGFFDHEDPEGRGPSDRIAEGHRRLIGTSGENIWAGSGYPATNQAEVEALLTTIMTGWMESSGHRENILRPEFTHLGVGIAQRGRDIRATQNFAAAQAYFEHPIPRRLRRGQELGLQTRPAGGSGRPTRWDLWPVNGDRPADEMPRPIADGTVDKRPGSYRLQLYFPESATRYTIYPGPRIEVVE